MAKRRSPLGPSSLFGYAMVVPLLIGLLWYVQARPAASPPASADLGADPEAAAAVAARSQPYADTRSYRDERAAFEKYLRFQENAPITRARRTGTVVWKAFERGPSKDQEDPDGMRDVTTREEAESTRNLMFPDSPTTRILGTRTAPYDEVWTGTADTGHEVEAYWNRGKFIVWFKLGRNDFTQDGNRLLIGDRHWFERAVRD